MTRRLSAETLATLAETLFGVAAEAVPLAGECQLNARLDVDGRPRYLLKIYDADAPEVVLQEALHAHLAEPESALRHSATTVIDGRSRVAHLLDWVEGAVWAAAGPADTARLVGLGAAVARLDTALAGFDHPALDRPYRWNPLYGNELQRTLPILTDRDRPIVEYGLSRLAAILPTLRSLPRQAIHNDANDHNVIVAADGSIAGIIDFGDIVRAPRVCGLAVAMTYVQLDTPDPISAATAVASGYHGESPLTATELALLPDLIDIRLATSVANAAEQYAADPTNDYLTISQPQIRRLVATSADHPRPLLEARLRDACGYRPIAAERAIVSWLRSAECRPARILRTIDIRPPSDERVHLGVELCGAPGEPVLSPLDGTVIAVDEPNNAVLLEHHTGDGTPFWSRLRHLGERTAEQGDHLRAGDPLAHLPTDEPHLHLQLFTTLLDRLTDLPHTADPAEQDIWESISPYPNLLLRQPISPRSIRRRTASEIAARRRSNLSAALSLSYDEPLHIASGRGAELIDAHGRRYLDLVNNVCHVGHCHPRVVEALSTQAGLLNTNTRYLHANLTDYARRLAATFPDPLNVVFLTNSGSEANDLALRLARTATGREHTLVLDWAYHGNLTSLIEISPYKFNGRGGLGPGPRVRICAVPDPYRGEFGSDGRRYVADVAAHCAELTAARTPPAAFIHESIPGCAGQIDLADGYLEHAYATARAAGALCIADEVQCGFGRVGTHMWAFERHGVTPDIVTLGKPIGNGHPIGAVVTTPQVARRFVTGMEYFNTFGGNPVSCAVASAVLDVMEDERLTAHAQIVGGRLRTVLESLAERHDAIGDVRGRGLFLGVDVVTDRQSKRPDRAVAERIVEVAKHEGILLSTDGPANNVLKIKPPMVLSMTQAEHAAAVIGNALDQIRSSSSKCENFTERRG
ncbi:aminotransferase class III-fold pyridoxal phosphate-dependent enzyme [Nocardia pseudobrasiliensis]|uniref:4-aminobutyrate aminotransferase-like enzyme n=1 Tax=Nocardia pseudobrasiliensis TaxID=45979 RepID=A0A370I872_9NOCA|nr:aminotransferase class III-fold pyridoxal phosphate-dependent enzyme [Nocardia pseudobrasiliensis]RDI65574.1 4-aminobutyrate aminotransferase-like enzyme [Nocardia pseudobrasiliensis]